MKTAHQIMGVKSYEEKFLYLILSLRDCTTKQDVETVCNDPMFKALGYIAIMQEVVKALPQVIKNLGAIYGNEKGGEV